jgi:lipopolysaccharide/colanic/teichoic acid biosynthesis glycosyltransferase
MSPIMLIISIAIKLSSKGPILYKGERLGKDRNIFIIYKFRTMYEGTEAIVGARLIGEDEGHITKVGKVIRLLKLDELPQFINVIKGDMNLIGPRPLRPEMYDIYVKEHSKYTERFKVKPGISGLAQVRRGYYIEPKNKLRYDLLYIQNRSLGLDLKIAIYTFFLIIQKVSQRVFYTLFSRFMRKHKVKVTGWNTK